MFVNPFTYNVKITQYTVVVVVSGMQLTIA